MTDYDTWPPREGDLWALSPSDNHWTIFYRLIELSHTATPTTPWKFTGRVEKVEKYPGRARRVGDVVMSITFSAHPDKNIGGQDSQSWTLIERRISN